MVDGQNQDKGTKTPGRGRCAIAAEPSWTKKIHISNRSIFTQKGFPITNHLSIRNFTSPSPPFHNLASCHHAAASPGLRFSWTSPRWPADIEFVRTASWNSKESSWLKQNMGTLRFNLSWLAWLGVCSMILLVCLQFVFFFPPGNEKTYPLPFVTFWVDDFPAETRLVGICFLVPDWRLVNVSQHPVPHLEWECASILLLFSHLPQATTSEVGWPSKYWTSFHPNSCRFQEVLHELAGEGYPPKMLI